MIAILSAAVLCAAPTAVERTAAKTMTPELLKSHIRFLASDALEGRGPATAADRVAQVYIASQFEGLGLKPASPTGGWFQPVELVGVNGAPKKLSFVGKASSPLELKFSDDFIAVSGHQKNESSLDKAELVFVGYGIVAPEFEWNDFKGADLRGKVLVVMNNDPDDDPALFGGKTRLWYGRWDYKYEQAAKLGAAGCIIIHTTASAGYPWQVVQTSWTGEQFDLPASEGPALQVKAWTTEDATRKVFALNGHDLDALRVAAKKREFRPVPLGVTITTQFNNIVAKKTSANVLGMLEGTDPKLKSELVIYTAHHDHLGKKANAKAGEDDIYNGAVDNASGVAAMLSVARAITALPKAPKRSIIFAAVAAEEQGLLGSQYLAQHPPVPAKQIAIDINIDGINIWGKTKDISVIGLGKSTVDDFIRELANDQGRTVKPDALADRGFFYRSDQFNFAKRGVPVAYFSSGHEFIGRPEGWGKEQREKWEGTNYHQPSDEMTDSWNVEGALEDIRLYFHLGVNVANAPSMPMWTKGDEFERIRLDSIGASR